MRSFREYLSEELDTPLTKAMKSHLKKSPFPMSGARGWLDSKGGFWGFKGRHEHDQSAAIINSAHGVHIPLATDMSSIKDSDKNTESVMQNHGLVRVSASSNYLFIHSHRLSDAQHKVLRHAATKGNYDGVEHHQQGIFHTAWKDEPTFKSKLNKVLNPRPTRA